MNRPPEEQAELETIIKFLCGERMLDGMWFGNHLDRPTFWWRVPLREAHIKAQARTRAALIAEVRAGLPADKLDYSDEYNQNRSDGWNDFKAETAALLTRLETGEKT